MEFITLIIAITALGLHWHSFYNNSYRVELVPFFDYSEDLYSAEQPQLGVSVVNSGNRKVFIRRILATTSPRETGGLAGMRRSSIVLKKFNPPVALEPYTSEDWKILLEDKEIIEELYNSDAFISVIDGMGDSYERTIVNGKNNKKMRRARKNRRMD